MNDPILPVETLPIANLKAHPRNYRGHPEDQIEHLRASIRENGMYRNVVIASDGTILAGHGITIAATAEGLSEVPCIRMPFGPDDPAALKILVGDNELGLRAEPDDRALSMILKDLRDADPTAGLTGTGYDDAMLASLLFVTRDRSEIADLDAAAHWLGLPDYDNEAPLIKLVVSFENEADRQRFIDEHGIVTTKRLVTSPTWQAWWPERERADLKSVRYVDDALAVER